MRALAAALLASTPLAVTTLAVTTPLAWGAAKGAAQTHGAIAFHRDSLSFGYAIDRRNARDAQVEALRQCGHARCEVVARLHGNCGAVANGPKKSAAGRGVTRSEAETKAQKSCGAGCDTVIWACTK